MRTLDRIVSEVAQGEVSFPTHADVAFRVRLALDDPDLHVAKAAQIIQAEPLLAARVVALANSVAFSRNGIPVADVRSGVARLGLRFVRALATALVMRQMAGSLKSPVYQALGVRLWEHTVHVAALAHVLARHNRIGSPDTALFAGIVHEVSGFYLISRSDAYPDLFADGSLLSREAETGVGLAVLAALAVPAEVVSAIAALWRGGPVVFPPRTLGDLLCLANRLTPILSPLQRQEPEDSILPVEANSVLADILEQSGDEMGEMTSALRY
jgi:HD-like signal output (HDOD) protein